MLGSISKVMIVVIGKAKTPDGYKGALEAEPKNINLKYN